MRKSELELLVNEAHEKIGQMLNDMRNEDTGVCEVCLSSLVMLCAYDLQAHPKPLSPPPNAYPSAVDSNNTMNTNGSSVFLMLYLFRSSIANSRLSGRSSRPSR